MTIDAEPAGTVGRQRAATTVRDATYDLLRAYGLTTIFGNVGSTRRRSWKTSPPTSGTSWGCKRPLSSRWPTASRRQRTGRRWSTCTPEPV
jgi:hypothetical protein